MSQQPLVKTTISGITDFGLVKTQAGINFLWFKAIKDRTNDPEDDPALEEMGLVVGAKVHLTMDEGVVVSPYGRRVQSAEIVD